MRIVILTHYYPPEVGAPQTRLSALAQGLSDAGIEVVVHTTFPHYPDGRIKPPYRNGVRARERDREIEVIRSAVIPAANRGRMRRLLDHASFAAGAVITSRAAGAADVVIVETPPLFTAGAAIPYARLKRAALVLNVSDLWPDSAVELGAVRASAAIRAARALESRCYRAADAIVCPTEGIEGRLESRPEAAAKVHRVLPAVNLAAFDPAPGARAGDGPFAVVYVGTLGLAQGVATLVEAAARLEPGRIELTIAGDGAEAGELGQRAAALPNVRMVGPVPHADVPALLANADAVAVTLRDRPVFAGALPTKMFEAMAAGRPLVVSARGEAARFVERSRAGVVVPPEDPNALAEALLELASDRRRAASLGVAGRRFAEAGLGRERYLAEWIDLLKHVA
jgi:glycosyltransferase involved in cell wall biosynthesis